MYEAYLEQEKYDMTKRAWEAAAMANVMLKIHVPKSKKTFTPLDFYDPNKVEEENEKASRPAKRRTKEENRSILSFLKGKFGATL